ncbi:FAD-binding oxidoreductase [Parachitinimonas caeni]|uniref:FAD-binding oxidoreductase n=1 Tax=Parachitinimonas caeni TaxID=3031301 RepID=A0ABT7E289_9NEIS|nr:FAD-binding oxidoreductase [Parachitinimonas caeni]MDK2126427.1 FAD-binding oxidoreductase [Parachitinimonas caeni]
MPAPQFPATRRTFLCQSLAALGWLAMPALRPAWAAIPIPNVTRLYTVSVAKVVVPLSVQEVCATLKAWPGQVAVGGGRYSMGGQIGIQDGLHLDMRSLNQLVWIQPEQSKVRIQAGMRWRDLQEVLDPLGLAVQTMQSYSNFTIGGSVSVNAHGRYVGNGPVGHSVLALQLVLADGSVREASPKQNADLFAAVIGGYGALAVITEIELQLARNSHIERAVRIVPLDAYVEHFQRDVLADERSVLHNADLMPPRFDAPVSVTWRTSDQPLTVTERLVPRNRSYRLDRSVLLALTEVPGALSLRRKVIHPLLNAGSKVQWRNREASLDVAELEPENRAHSTYVLQEYFIPPKYFTNFARGMAAILRANRAKVLNVSVRHSPADKVSLMAWAKQEVFSFVLFYKQGTSAEAQAEVGEWTRQLIDLALQHEGRYYLPYQLHASRQQFEQAYPEVIQLRGLKQKYDPAGKLSNSLWQKYL